MDQPSQPRWSRTDAGVLAAAALILVGHSLLYGFVTDDAYISFVFARNLVEHGELTFNLGDPVEGYTNFLWTVILAGAMAVGVPPETSSVVLGTTAALVNLAVTTRLVARVVPEGSWRRVPALLLACSSGYACWSSGGLETQLFTLLVVLAVDAAVAAHAQPRAFAWTGLWLALAAMTRPEGLFLTAIVALHRLVTNLWFERRWRPSAAEWAALAGFLVIWAPWFVWRWDYYGHPFPNTYYVKAAGPWQPASLRWEMWGSGFYYLWAWAWQSQVLVGLPLVGIGLLRALRGATATRTSQAFATLVLAIVPFYLLYVASVGGDFMGLHRFILPNFVLVVAVVTTGAAFVWGEGRAARVGPPAVVLVFAATQAWLTAQSAWLQADHYDRGMDSPAFLRVYTNDRGEIGKAMAPCFRPTDFSIVGGTGAQPYYGRMRAIDVYGLVSDRIAHQSPRTNARAGHTKWGSFAILASYQPDFVFSCYKIHPTPEMPELKCARPWIDAGFEAVTLHVPALEQKGDYYTFLAKKERDFQCPGVVGRGIPPGSVVQPKGAGGAAVPGAGDAARSAGAVSPAREAAVSPSGAGSPAGEATPGPTGAPSAQD